MNDIIELLNPFGVIDNVLRVTNTSSNDILYTFGNILDMDSEYTFSVWIKADRDEQTTIFISNQSKNFQVTTSWQRFVFTSQSDISSFKEVMFSIPSNTILYAYQGQLERGTKASDFTENPKDIQRAISNVDSKVVVLQTDFKVEQGRIAALIKNTTIDNGDGTTTTLKDKFFDMESTVDGIKTNIGESTFVDGESLNSKLTSINASVDGIKTEVSNVDSKAESAKTIAEQTANKFSWVVKSGNNETDFTLTDRTAKLVAENINLNGLVTFNGLNTDAQDKISNGLSAKNTIDNWNKIEINPDETTINGGYIQTDSINSNQIDTNELWANEGFISNFHSTTIVAEQIGAKSIKSDKIDLYGLSMLDKNSDVETLSITDNGDITLRGTIESYNYSSGKTGWSMSQNGDMELNDITVRGSVVTNDGGIVSGGGSGENLLLNSSMVHGYTAGVGYDEWICTGTVQKANHQGDYCARIVGAFETTQSVSQDILPRITPKANQHYTVSALVKCTGYKAGVTNPLVSLFFNCYYNNNGTTEIAPTITVSGDKDISSISEKGWVEMKWTVTFEQIPTSLKFYVYCRDFEGMVYFRNLKIEEGDIATSWSLSPLDKIKEVRFWAGSSYDERENAPWIVYNDGSMKSTMGEFGGIFTGDIQIGNISIIDPNNSSGDDAILTIQNGDNGIKRVQLRDTENSSFSQNIIITSNAGHEKITLGQDGYGNFANGITVGTSGSTITSKLTSSVLYLGDHRISAGTALNAVTPQFVVGSATLDSQLFVYGDANIRGDLKVEKSISFNDVIECTIHSRGIDFDFK